MLKQLAVLGRLLWLIAALALPAQAADVPAVLILLSENSPAHVEVSDAVRAELSQAGRTDVEVSSDPAELTRASLRFVVTVGTAAFQSAVNVESKAPVLAALLPRSAYERIADQAARRGNRPLSAVFLDQPVSRQLDLIRIALPEKHRVGVVFGPDSAPLASALHAAGQDRDLRLSTSRANTAEEIFPALQRVIGEADLLLAEPDTLVYNSATIQNILLTSYRAQIPLIGFSPAYIRAGALLALYSTPAQIGHQAGEIVRTWLSGRPLPAPQLPKEFSVSVNPHVARSLGLHLDDPGSIADRIRVAERRP